MHTLALTVLTLGGLGALPAHALTDASTRALQ